MIFSDPRGLSPMTTIVSDFPLLMLILILIYSVLYSISHRFTRFFSILLNVPFTCRAMTTTTRYDKLSMITAVCSLVHRSLTDCLRLQPLAPFHNQYSFHPTDGNFQTEITTFR